MNEGEAEELAARLLAAVENARVPKESDEADRLEAARSAAERLKQLMARTPWAIIPPAWLDEVQTAFDPVIATIESYASTEDESASFDVTWAEIQRLWAALSPFVAASIPEVSVAEDAATFRRSTGQMTRRLSDEVEATGQEAKRLKEQLESLIAERDAALTEIQDQQTALQGTITEQSGRLDTAIATHDTQFSEAQDRHRVEFENALQNHEGELAKHLGDAEKGAREILVKVDERAGELLANIEELERKATESYSTIGGSSVARYYQADANEEQKQARRWRKFAVLAFLLVAVGTIIELFASDGSLGWEQTRSRLPVIFGLGGFAIFAVAEARAHRRAERESRDREVKLSSIDPYLILTENPQRADALKLDFARSLFIGSAEEEPESPPSDDPED